MAKLQKITITGNFRIPDAEDKYNPIKGGVSATFHQDPHETDEEFYANAYKEFSELNNATAALELEKRERINKNQGNVEYWGQAILKAFKSQKNRFFTEFKNLLKK